MIGVFSDLDELTYLPSGLIILGVVIISDPPDAILVGLLHVF